MSGYPEQGSTKRIISDCCQTANLAKPVVQFLDCNLNWLQWSVASRSAKGAGCCASSGEGLEAATANVHGCQIGS